MITSRQRMLDAFEFKRPDKIPVVYHPSQAGLHIHGQKLLDLFNAYPPDNPISFTELPVPASGAPDGAGRYHEFRKDEWGTEWEYLIFGIQGHPRRYPFNSWDETDVWTFPSLPPLNATQIAKQRQDYLVFGGWVSIFEKLHALRPMDDLLVDLISGDPALIRFLDRLTDHWLADIHRMLEARVDVIMFGDDWGTQEAPLISPDLFKELFLPRYARLMAPIRKAGKKIFLHSCGCLGEVLDEFIALGINGLWPQIGVFEANPANLEKCRQHQVTLYIHPDRQRLIPKGSPAEIEATIRRYAERYHEQGGGGIFYVEIENDAPFENVKTLIESIARWR